MSLFYEDCDESETNRCKSGFKPVTETYCEKCQFLVYQKSSTDINTGHRTVRPTEMSIVEPKFFPLFDFRS